MPARSPELRALVESGPLAHLTTINADGGPQVSVVWLGLDGGYVVRHAVGRVGSWAQAA